MPITIKTTSFVYQKEEKASIEKEYFKMRVRDAHYRNQSINILKKKENGMIKQLVTFLSFFLKYCFIIYKGLLCG